MSPLMRLGLLSAATIVLFGGVASAVVAAAYPRAKARLAGLQPSTRAQRVLTWAALPWVVSALLLALCFVPSVWSVLGLAVDHCPLHDDEHIHLCVEHAPHHPVTMVEWLLLAAGGLAVGVVALRELRAQLATWRAVTALVRGAGLDGEGGLVASSAPLSVTAGLLRPLVLVSTGLRSGRVRDPPPHRIPPGPDREVDDDALHRWTLHEQKTEPGSVFVSGRDAGAALGKRPAHRG